MKNLTLKFSVHQEVYQIVVFANCTWRILVTLTTNQQAIACVNIEMYEEWPIAINKVKDLIAS